MLVIIIGIISFLGTSFATLTCLFLADLLLNFSQHLIHFSLFFNTSFCSLILIFNFSLLYSLANAFNNIALFVKCAILGFFLFLGGLRLDIDHLVSLDRFELVFKFFAFKHVKHMLILHKLDLQMLLFTIVVS